MLGARMVTGSKSRTEERQFWSDWLTLPLSGAFCSVHMNWYIQSDQKVSVHVTITVHSTGAQRIFDHPVYFMYIHEGAGVAVIVPKISGATVKNLVAHVTRRPGFVLPWSVHCYLLPRNRPTCCLFSSIKYVHHYRVFTSNCSAVSVTVRGWLAVFCCCRWAKKYWCRQTSRTKICLGCSRPELRRSVCHRELLTCDLPATTDMPANVGMVVLSEGTDAAFGPTTLEAKLQRNLWTNIQRMGQRRSTKKDKLR